MEDSERMRSLLGRRWIRGLLLGALVLVAWNRVRQLTRPSPPRPDAAVFEQAKRVRIARDVWGVPHIHGQSDADAAFGLAYAHAEDDWPMVQSVIAAARGQLGLISPSKTALANDFYANLVGIKEEVDGTYPQLSPEFRAVLEGYAAGLSLYAFLHPEDADGRLPPFTGKDVAASFAHKIPIMVGLSQTLEALFGDEPRRAGDPVLGPLGPPAEPSAGRDAAPAMPGPGSNAHGVSSQRSADGVARLNVNSHQPWEGPVSWYEAQVESDEGWNMTGGTFPGAPLILHGHNDHLGWAHTVNAPDLIDVYALTMNPEHPNDYKFDGAWRTLGEKKADLPIDTGFFVFHASKPVYRSVHGPVIETSHGFYALKYAGMGRRVRAGEQWYRMNRAASFAEWKSAMQMQAIPMFNCVYVDRDNIYYLYNALVPQRGGTYDYSRILPGELADALWGPYLPFEQLPQLENPTSGFVQNCNSAPWFTTSGKENPKPEPWAASAGLETKMNNRTARSLALLGKPGPISRDDFLGMKWDRRYAKDASIFREVVRPVLTSFRPQNDDHRRALEILSKWDGTVSDMSAAATIAILSWRPIAGNDAGAGPAELTDPREAFGRTIDFLLKTFGTVEVPWNDIQRLRRGKLDLPLGGGPDLINAVLARWEEGRLVGYQGDSYVLIAEFPKEGPAVSSSVQQYGSSNRPGSPHYADQAPLYTKRELKPTLRSAEQRKKMLEREYHPGEEIQR